MTLTLSRTHGEQLEARRAYPRIASFLALLRQTAEQLDPVQRRYRILSDALKRYLKGRQLDPPLRQGCDTQKIKMPIHSVSPSMLSFGNP